MTTADRTLSALVVALTLTAGLVRPVWRAIDPGPADYLRACAALRAREAVDPWGTPWIRTPWNPMGGVSRLSPEDVSAWEVGSAGPDGLNGTADDLPFISWVQRDEHGRLVINTWYDPSPESWAWSYRSSPAVPVAVALVLLLTRWVSGAFSRPGPSRFGRAVVACGLASGATFLVLLVAAANGSWRLVEDAPFAGVIPPAAAAIGSLYLLLTAAVFAHRELHHLQKTEGEAQG